MKDVISLFRDVVIQIATPYSTGGTGFYLKEFNLIVTNEHVVRGNRNVVIDGETISKQLVRVLYTDEKYDLAFLEAPQAVDLPAVSLGDDEQIEEGMQVIAIGHPFGLKYTSTQGIISNAQHRQHNLNYLQHDAALNPGNSGGPLVTKQGHIIGVNTFIIKNGDNIGFSLPINYLKKTLSEFAASKGVIGSRCPSCSNLVFETTIDNGYCPHCGTVVELPSRVEVYEPIGVAYTIEELLKELGYNVELARSGPNVWEIQKGSAKINISYYERNGLITGDAYLCTLSKNNIKELYEYLLRQNYDIEGLTFSIKGQDIILSLLIFDRYLNVETGIELFNRLFEQADHYDNILVEEYGASWKYEQSNNQ
jgi:serine protease Do